MSKQLDLSSLIRESNYIYHQNVIQGIKTSYGPGDSLELYFPKGPYICNFAETELWNRFIVKTDQPNSCPLYNDIKAMYNITSIQADGLDLCPSQGTRSRPVFNAVIDRFKTWGPKEADPRKLQMSDVEFQFKSSGTLTTARNTHMLTSDEVILGNLPLQGGQPIAIDTADSYFQDFQTPTYRQVYRRRLNQLLRYGQFSTVALPANNGAILGGVFTYNQLIDPATDGTTYVAGLSVPVVYTPAVVGGTSGGGVPIGSEGQTWQAIKLGDLAIELASMNQVYMGQFSDGIRVSIRLIEAKYCMSNILPRMPHNDATAGPNTANTDNTFTFSQLTSYRLADVFIAQRNHYLTVEGNKLLGDISMSNPVPYITYQYQLVPLNAANTLIYRNTLNSQGLLGIFIAHTGKGPNSNTFISAINGVNYRGPSIYQEPVNQYNSDHFFLETTNAQVTVGQTIYKQNKPYVGANGQYASYLSNIDSSGVLMPGKIYNMQFYEFIDRGAVIFLPTNSIGGAGINARGENIEVNIEYNLPQSTGKRTQDHDAHLFYLITSSMRKDATKGIIIE